MSTGNEKILILGLGGAGGKVVSRIASQHISGLDTAVIDTDQDALQTMEPNVQSLFAGSCLSWGQGTGCGGNVIRGEQAISGERHKIMELISDKKFIVVVAGLGGGVVTALCGFPSVDYAAHTIMHHLEDYGSQRYEIGYSSAIATVLFLVMIGSNMVVKKALSKVGT